MFGTWWYRDAASTPTSEASRRMGSSASMPSASAMGKGAAEQFVSGQWRPAACSGVTISIDSFTRRTSTLTLLGCILGT